MPRRRGLLRRSSNAIKAELRDKILNAYDGISAYIKNIGVHLTDGPQLAKALIFQILNLMSAAALHASVRF